MGFSIFGKSSASRAATGNRAPCDPIPSQFVVRHIYESAREPIHAKPPIIPKVRAPKCHVGRIRHGKRYILAEIVYPNCPTFEGRKLILFEGVTASWLRRQTAIDPHFMEGGHIVARFAPTPEGLRLAKRFLS